MNEFYAFFYLGNVFSSNCVHLLQRLLQLGPCQQDLQPMEVAVGLDNAAVPLDMPHLRFQLLQEHPGTPLLLILLLWPLPALQSALVTKYYGGTLVCVCA